ncbi:hypothetical protein [Pontibacter flavimaris]|uniref:hypothetical protein n=1 Tax=Pontibacter flavimaris TaxID=1797110 RepID=UPI0011150E6D|nr:hypothetical protein [Pontibacter flavimaris]
MYKCKYILLVCVLLLCSCGGRDSESAAGEQELANYRNYVTRFEQDSLSDSELRALALAENSSTTWQTEKESLLQAHEGYRVQLEENLEHLTEQQRAEAGQLDQRFKNALETREHQFLDASHRYELRQDLLGLDIEDDDLSEVTAENIGPTYSRFVSGIKEHAAKYESRDWLLIAGWWSALNSRYRSVEGDVSEQVKKTVQQAQKQYQEVVPKEDTAKQQTEKPQQQ